MQNIGKALSRDELLEMVWGHHYVGELKIVDVNIRRLRIKIEDDPAEPSQPYRYRARIRVYVGRIKRWRFRGRCPPGVERSRFRRNRERSRFSAVHGRDGRVRQHTATQAVFYQRKTRPAEPEFPLRDCIGALRCARRR